MQRFHVLYYVTIFVWFDSRPKDKLHKIQHSSSPIHTRLDRFYHMSCDPQFRCSPDDMSLADPTWLPLTNGATCQYWFLPTGYLIQSQACSSHQCHYHIFKSAGLFPKTVISYITPKVMKKFWKKKKWFWASEGPTFWRTLVSIGARMTRAHHDTHLPAENGTFYLYFVHNS